MAKNNGSNGNKPNYGQGKPFNPDRAAMVLAEATVYGDVRASRNWGCSTRSIRQWRQRVADDEVFASKFSNTLKLIKDNWAHGVPDAIRAGVAFILEAAQKADPKDPDAINAVASAVERLAGIQMAKQVIDVRLAEQSKHADRAA